MEPTGRPSSSPTITQLPLTEKKELKTQILMKLWTDVYGTAPSRNQPEVYSTSTTNFIANTASLLLKKAYAGILELADKVRGQTLDKAIAKGDTETAIRMLLKGALVTDTTEEALEKLIGGTNWKPEEAETLENLLKLAKKMQTDSSIKDKGLSLVHYFVMNIGKDDPDAHQKIKDLTSLLKHGANIYVTDSEGQTALHYASHPGVIRALLNLGALPTAQDNKGVTPVHKVAERGEADALHEFGREHVNIQSALGQTPLHYAASSGNLKGVRELLFLGASRDIPDKEGVLPLFLAIGKSKAMAEEFSTSHMYGIQYSLKNLDVRDNQNRTVFHYACRNKESFHPDTIRALGMAIIKSGTQLRPNDPIYVLRNLLIAKDKESGLTPLHELAKWGGEQEFEALLPLQDPWIHNLLSTLPNGPHYIDTLTPSGCTPLYEAVASGNLSAVKALIARGANVKLGDQSGVTPLHLAVGQRNGNELVVELLKAGADPNQKNQGGQSPLDLATKQAKPDLVTLLSTPQK